MARRLDGVDASMALLVLMWGTAFATIKILGQKLDPLEMTWLRYVPFLFVFGVWLLVRRRERFAQVSGNDWIRFGVAGGLGVIGYHVPLNWAMSSTTPGVPVGAPTAAILVATTPLWVLLFAVAAGQERFSVAKASGSAIAFVGVVLVVLRGTGGGGDVDLVGKALIGLLAPILWGGYSIIAKPLITRYGGLFVTGLTMCLGTLSFVPFGISRGVAPVADFAASDWLWLAYLSIAATVGGYTIWNQALKRRTASEVTVYIFAIPVVATLASVLLIQENITAWFVAGAALVLVGLVIIHRARLPAPSPARAQPVQL